MTTAYQTNYICPECGDILNKRHVSNAWSNIYTPMLICSNPKCKFEIYPTSREQQDIFDKFMRLRERRTKKNGQMEKNRC